MCIGDEPSKFLSTKLRAKAKWLFKSLCLIVVTQQQIMEKNVSFIVTVASQNSVIGPYKVSPSRPKKKGGGRITPWSRQEPFYLAARPHSTSR